MRIVIASLARTFIESVVETHPGIIEMLVVRSKDELQELIADSDQAIDLIVNGLVLDRTTPIRHKNDLYVQQDALRFVRETLGERPDTRFVVCAAYWHVRVVMKSYAEGARWFVRDNPHLDQEVVNGLTMVAAGERLEPYGLDVTMRNQWIARHDQRLAGYSNRDLEILEAWLVDRGYTEALVERLGVASLPVAYTRISTLAKRGGFEHKEALTEYALNAGLEPIDRCRSRYARLVDYPVEPLRELLDGIPSD